MNLYQIKLTDNQKAALEHLFAQGIIWSKTELSEAWDELREQVKDAANTVAIINAIQDAKCNCTKASAPAMKYDPNRRFKEGDRVKPRERDGRAPWGRTITSVRCLNTSWTLNVREDEARGIVKCEDEDGVLFDISPFFLELITPVEERDPYYVSTNIDCSTCTIFKRVGEKILVHSAYYFVNGKGFSNAILGITEAQASAEAECARLNAKWRKEQEK